MENKDLAKIFEEMAAATDFLGDSPFKSRTYRLAAETIRENGPDIDILMNTHGLGKAVLEKTQEFLENGRIRKHEQLMELVPAKYKDLIVEGKPKLLGEEWRKEIKKRFFTPDGRLKSMPSKFAVKYIVLLEIAASFETKAEYSETDVNSVLMGFHDDYVALRRYLIDFGFLIRRKDGSNYTRGD